MSELGHEGGYSELSEREAKICLSPLQEGRLFAAAGDLWRKMSILDSWAKCFLNWVPEQCLSHVNCVKSLEKTLMLGKTEGRRRKGERG